MRRRRGSTVGPEFGDDPLGRVASRLNQTAELGRPPSTPNGQNLWLQHAAGYVIFRDAWKYAVDAIPSDAAPDTRALAVKAASDAIYGMMMIADGVTGALENAEHQVVVSVHAELRHRESDRWGEPIQSLDFQRGDGACMGFHYWREGDFGSDPVAVPKHAAPRREGDE